MYISKLLAAHGPPYVEHLIALKERLYDGRREEAEKGTFLHRLGRKRHCDVRLNTKEYKIVTMSAFNESV